MHEWLPAVRKVHGPDGKQETNSRSEYFRGKQLLQQYCPLAFNNVGILAKYLFQEFVVLFVDKIILK